MRPRTASLLFAVLLTSPAWADQITLKNGDVLSGKIVKKEGASLVLDSKEAGKVTVPWASVVKVSTDDPVAVVLPDGRTVIGKLGTQGEMLEVITVTGAEKLKLAEVRVIRNEAEQKAAERLERPSVLDLWAGYADFGVSLARGNAESTTLTTAFSATRATKTDKTTLHFHQIYARATVNNRSSTTANAARGGWAYNRNLHPRVFASVFNDYEYDAFQNLDLRFVAGGGLGVTAVKTERTELALPLGVAYNREKFATGLVRNSAEVFWGDDFTHKATGVTSLRQAFRMFHNLSETGEFRLNFDIGLATTLSKSLAWPVTVSDRYLSNPLAGRRKNDVIFSTGLRWNFAR